MSKKIYCPRFIAALLPTISEVPVLSEAQQKNASESMQCIKEECGFFSKKHGVCAVVAIADKPPLTVALDIPVDGSDVVGWDNK